MDDILLCLESLELDFQEQWLSSFSMQHNPMEGCDAP